MSQHANLSDLQFLLSASPEDVLRVSFLTPQQAEEVHLMIIRLVRDSIAARNADFRAYSRPEEVA